VITRFATDIKNNGECFTDSNGREMLRRQRDERDSWPLQQTEPVAGNYFPVNTAVFIRDASMQLTVLTETSQAGSGCVRDGEIEVMVHRRVLKDDNKGVGEPLNETRDITPYAGGKGGQHRGPGLVVRGRHWLRLDPPAEAASRWRPLADRLYMPFTPVFSSAAPTVDVFSPLRKELPDNVQIVSLYQWDETHWLLRLAHQFGLEEDLYMSNSTTVDLDGLFAHFVINTVEERGLAGTISRDEVLRRRVPWSIEGEASAPMEKVSGEATSRVITLGPLQIRTFLLGVSPSEQDDVVLV